MPHYKVIYFNGRGRAESIRMVFEHAGVKYEDIRLEAGSEEYKAYQEKSPFGQFPLLEIDGELFAQSHAILRYVGHEHGLAGDSPINKLRVDMILDGLEDIVKSMAPWRTETDPKKKEELMQKIVETSLPKFMGKLEEIVKKNGTPGFSVGKSLTISDIALSNSLSYVQNFVKTFDCNKYSSLIAIQTNVFAQPKIKAWIEKRPVTPF